MPWFTPRRIEMLRARTAASGRRSARRGGRCGRLRVHGRRRHADSRRRSSAGWSAATWSAARSSPHWSAIALQAFSGDPAVMGDVRDALRYLRRFADELLEAKQRAPGDDITTALAAGIEQAPADALRRAIAAHRVAERVGRQHHALDGPDVVAALRTSRSVGARRRRRRPRGARGRRVRALRTGDPAREALQRARRRAPRGRRFPRAR